MEASRKLKMYVLANSRARFATHKTGFWPARFSSLEDLDDVYADWRDRTARPRRHATGRFVVGERLAVEREALRPLPPAAFDAAGRRSSRVPLDGYLKRACRFSGAATAHFSFDISRCSSDSGVGAPRGVAAAQGGIGQAPTFRRDFEVRIPDTMARWPPTG
jgi:hypothetical protein